MLIHTHSLFISIAGILAIVFSFPISVVIYTLIFQVTYISGFHFISVYLMFGIGSDNIFLVHDAWYQSNSLKELKEFNESPTDIKVRRMSFAFRRAF